MAASGCPVRSLAVTCLSSRPTAPCRERSSAPMEPWFRKGRAAAGRSSHVRETVVNA